MLQAGLLSEIVAAQHKHKHFISRQEISVLELEDLGKYFWGLRCCGKTTDQVKLSSRKKYSQRRKKLWDSELVWRQSSVILVWDWVEERNHKDDGELNLRSDDTDMTQCDSSQRNKVVLEVSGQWTVDTGQSSVLCVGAGQRAATGKCI